MTEPQPAIRLAGLTKEFGAVTAVDHVDLEIAAGEFFSMLGPSGSGKTTVLRLIAGFEQPTGGTIQLFGEDVTTRAPFDRDVNTVFQDYALFPHMSVLDNVAYGLRVRGIGRKERNERAMRALESVQLEQLATRKPSQLSGGQRQRVALARATVVEPKVLLLDEPLGALDLKLREQMQVELKQIQRDLGITFIFVTHDQEEALTLSDRIAVFNAGRIEQLGTPAELYERPHSRFVADFVGTSNLFDDEHSLVLLGREGHHSLRPEKMRVGTATEDGPGVNNALGTVVEAIFLGSGVRLVVDLDAGMRVSVLEQNVRGRAHGDRHGDRVVVSWHDDDVVAIHGAPVGPQNPTPTAAMNAMIPGTAG
ncbi:MAG TPA: ABC transporter ATP-binding protein [Agromyces sp.]|nr:ABC transporter ATP-binding protein [Agromyces sp.]